MSKNSQEEAPLREHEYDGIQEYDHKLPNWWLYTLYGAIIFFLVYWGLYYKTDLLQTDHEKITTRIAAIAEKREKALAATLATLDDASLVNKWAKDSSVVARGESIYNQVCVGCHGSDLSATMDAGGTSIPLPGLPLNDGEWKYGSKPLDVFNLINDGTPKDSPGHNGAKMQAWGLSYTPQQIAEVTAFLIAKNPDDFAGY